MNLYAAVLAVIIVVLPGPADPPAAPSPAVVAPASGSPGGGQRSVAPEQQQPPSSAGQLPSSGGQQPLAIVYVNPPFADADDAKDLATMLQKSRYKFRVQFAGSKTNPLTAQMLQQASLFGFPGGEVDDDTAKRDFAHEIPLVQNYVANGGRFLGVCAGGFVMGQKGFDVFPGEIDSYVGSPNSQAKDAEDQAIQINWMGKGKRTVDFQDGNYVKLPPGTPGVTVLGTYNNGLIAAAVAVHGRGKAGFSGPHFESNEAGKTPVHNLDMDFTLLDVLMK
jgi:glutamine amidotransferase-like uncharacterized protein